MVVTVDSKGRLVIPQQARAALGIAAGDSLFVEVGALELRLAKPTNPFDALAREALAEHSAGRTRALGEFAAKRGLTLDER
jgi:AbrB family looped-hinge helix DNA binding protein